MIVKYFLLSAGQTVKLNRQWRNCFATGKQGDDMKNEKVRYRVIVKINEIVISFIAEDKEQILYLLYKHRYVDFAALNILNPVNITLYKRLEKFIKSGYIKKIASGNIKVLIYAITKNGQNWLAQNIEQEFNKPVLSKVKTSSLYNFNHHLLIAKIGALLTSKNIDYEIDLTVKRAYPELKIIPDIVIK